MFIMSFDANFTPRSCKFIIISLLTKFAEIMMKNKHFRVRNKQGRGKSTLECHDIEPYAVA